MNRKNRYPIALCLAFVAVCTGLIVASMIYERHEAFDEYVDNNKTESSVLAENENSQESTAKKDEPVQIPASASVTQHGLDDGYVLEVCDGKLQVIELCTHHVFMDTEIRYEHLPKTVQNSIDEGRYFTSLDEVLAFLESYSS